MRNGRFSKGFGTEIDCFLFILVLTYYVKLKQGENPHVTPKRSPR
jgi:hypothetical protein